MGSSPLFDVFTRFATLPSFSTVRWPLREVLAKLDPSDFTTIFIVSTTFLFVIS